MNVNEDGSSDEFGPGTSACGIDRVVTDFDKESISLAYYVDAHA